MSLRLPSIWNRKTQDFALLAETRRYNPPPSCSTAGPFAFVTSTAESFPVRAMVRGPRLRVGECGPFPPFIPPSWLRLYDTAGYDGRQQGRRNPCVYRESETA